MRLEYFQMIDRFVEVNIGERRTRSICTVPKESTVFEGHFPGYPLMPGVLLIECMAQTTGWLVSALTGFTGLPALAGVKEGKIRAAVFPGDELEFEGKVVHEGSGYAVTKADIRCDGKLVCNAEITFRLIEFPNAEFRASMEKMAAILEFPMGTLAHG